MAKRDKKKMGIKLNVKALPKLSEVYFEKFRRGLPFAAPIMIFGTVGSDSPSMEYYKKMVLGDFKFQDVFIPVIGHEESGPFPVLSEENIKQLKVFNDKGLYQNINPIARKSAITRMETLLNFGEAIEALKLGKLITRKGWNGKGMFIVKQIPAVIGTDIIPKMQSLPQSVKHVFAKREQPISYENQMLIINYNGKADSWVPSSSDCFAEDWIILID